VLLPHLPKDIQPAHAKTSQGLSVSLPLLTFLLVVRLRPGALLAAKVSPMVHRCPQILVAHGAEVDVTALPASFSDWCDAGIALQCLDGGEHFAMTADFAQQPRGELLAGSRQRLEQITVGVIVEGLLDPFAVRAWLSLESSLSKKGHSRKLGYQWGEQLLPG